VCGSPRSCQNSPRTVPVRRCCACAMSQTAPHRHVRPLDAGCPRAVPRPPPPRRVGAAPEVRATRRIVHSVARLLAIGCGRESPPFYRGAWLDAGSLNGLNRAGNQGNHPVAPLLRELQLVSATSRCSEHRARVRPRVQKASESHNLGTCVPRIYREPDMTLEEEDETQTPSSRDDERRPATGRAA